METKQKKPLPFGRLCCATVIAAGLLSKKHAALADWFSEYGGDTLWSMMMYGIFALLFPEAK